MSEYLQQDLRDGARRVRRLQSVELFKPRSPGGAEVQQAPLARERGGFGYRQMREEWRSLQNSLISVVPWLSARMGVAKRGCFAASLSVLDCSRRGAGVLI